MRGLAPFRHRSILSRYPDFLKLFAGDTISNFGSSISTVALPLTAVIYLHATPLQMGVLGAAGLVPHLLFGLPAGVWVDRLPYRTVLVVVDLARALLLGAVPVLAAFGALRLWQLYVIMLLAGVATLFDAVASTSFVPLLVERRHLLPANSATVQSNSVVATTGSAIGGALVQVLTAPIAIAVDAFSFVISAIFSLRIQLPGSKTATVRKTRLWSDVVEGLRAVSSNRILRPLVLAATIGAIAGQLQSVVLVLYLARQLHLPSSIVGAALAVSGVAAVFGAFVAGPITRRLGHGPTFILGQLVASLAGFVLVAAAGPLPVVLAVLVAGQLLRGAGPPLYSVNQTTVRQSLAPPEMLTRVNATWRFLVFGAQPIGALLGGALGGVVGLRTTIVIGSLGMLAAIAVVTASPLRSLRVLPV